MDFLNYYKYRFKYLNGKYLNLKSPVDISLELASNCSLKCSYCYHAEDNKNKLPFKKGFMDYDTAKKIIRQGAYLGVNSIKFNYRGESTLNPKYREITEFAKKLSNKTVYIDRLANSNFKYHPNKRENIFLGLANLTKVKISYDSFRPDVFETQRAGGNHALITENIDQFYNHPSRIKSETRMVIQAVRTKLNLDEDIEFLCKKRWPDAKVSIRNVVEGRKESNIDEYAHKTRNKHKRIPCKQAFVRLIFTHEGNALPCCPDIKEELILGNINNMTMDAIFNSFFAKRIRSELKNGLAFKLDPCKNCSSFESYAGYKAPLQS